MNTHLSQFYAQLLKKNEADYALEFYGFLYDIITTTSFSEKLISGGKWKEHHLSPERICALFNMNIKRDFGRFTDLVLKTWGVSSSLDIGKAIFKMAEYNTLKLSGTEKLEDFSRAGLDGTGKKG